MLRRHVHRTGGEQLTSVVSARASVCLFYRVGMNLQSVGQFILAREKC